MADARLDAGRIAALTGVSAEAIQEQIAELERRRIIRGYKTVVDWERLGDDRVVAVAPREIAFSEQLPRTRSGKIMRRLLRARELGLPEGDLSTLEGAP